MYVLLWRLCEGQFQPCNDDECLRERDENIRRRLNPYVYALCRRVIDVVLQYARIYHGDRDQEEPSKNARDGIEIDFELAQCGVDDHCKDAR